MRSICFLLLISFLPCAAQPSIMAPALGYAYDAGLRAIRPVRGIPGAAVLDEPLRIGFVPTRVAIAPHQDYALAVSADQGLHLIRWNTAPVSDIAIDGAMATADRIVFSPSGAAAILYDSTSGRMQVLTGVSDSPAVRDIQAAGSTSATTFAIADDATVLVVAGDTALAITPDLNSIPLPLPGSVAALAFDRGSHDLLAITVSGDLYLAQNVNANLSIRQIYTGDAQTSNPVAVQFSPDESAAFIANGAGVLSTIDLNTGSISTISCQCAPTRLEPFGQGIFRLTDISDGPVLLFDGTPKQNRVWFVPADAQRSAQ
jgi:hypothetical protein